MNRERLEYPQIESGGSINLGNVLTGPTAEDIQWANSFKDEPVVVPRPIKQESSRPFLERIPISAKWGLRFGLPAFALALVAVACGESDSSKTEDRSG